MASVQIPGVLKAYKIDANDNQDLLATLNIQSIGAGGSPDKVITNSPEKWQYVSLVGDKPLNVNDRLAFTFTADTNATLDASDCAFICPITLSNGVVSYLKHPTVSSEWDIRQLGDTAFVADVETPAFEMRVKRGFFLGSNKEKAFISIEDNTA